MKSFLAFQTTLVTGFTEAYELLQINKLISIKNININLDGFVLDGLDSLLDCTTHGCQPATQQTFNSTNTGVPIKEMARYEI